MFCVTVSVKNVTPAVSTLWSISKKGLSINARVNKLLQHERVKNLECKLSIHTQSLITRMTQLRDLAIQKELTYLEKEVEKIKGRIKKCDGAKSVE